MSGPLLRAEHVGWLHGEGSGARDVSLTLEGGQITGFLGRNGAGKSTTMRLLAGVLVPMQGTITLDGLAVTSWTARARIGWAPEEAPTSPGLTVREHLTMARALIPSHRRAGRGVDDVLGALDLVAVADRLAGALSKGTRQRLGVGIALLGAPDVLLLDEPSSGLDPAQARALREVLLVEKARGAAVLVSSHVVAELALVADDVVALRDGVTVFHGPIADLEAATAAALALPLAPSSPSPSLSMEAGA